MLQRLLRPELTPVRTPVRAGELSRRSLVLFVFFPSLVALGLVYYQIRRGADSTSARDAFAIVSKDSTVILLDVQTPGEYAAGHVKNARLLPVEDLERRAGELDGEKGRLIIVYSRSGRRSRNAAAYLHGKGFRVLNIEGGILAWIEDGLPVLRETMP
jgi:rhodanese-related sulfurtransferase